MNKMNTCQIKQIVQKLECARCGMAQIELISMGVVAVQYVVPLLNHNNPDVRFRAMQILLKIGDLRAVQPLRQALEQDQRIHQHLTSQFLYIQRNMSKNETGGSSSRKRSNYSTYLNIRYNGGWGWDDEDWDIA